MSTITSLSAASSKPEPGPIPGAAASPEAEAESGSTSSQAVPPDIKTTIPKPAKKVPKGTIAIEEAVLNPSGISWMAQTASLFNPSSSSSASSSLFNPPSSPSSSSTGNPPAHMPLHSQTPLLLDIHSTRLSEMDAHGVEYMLLSLTSPGPQGQSDPVEAAKVAREGNDWLAAEVSKNPARFGALASVSMHDAEQAGREVRRCVQELGVYGVLQDFEVEGPGEGMGDGEGPGEGTGDGEGYRPFWREVERLGVPVYLHPRYPPGWELRIDGEGIATDGNREKGYAAVQFHLDLSKHIYAICSSGVFNKFPGVQVVVGHLGEGIPFNLHRANHWYNKPVKKASRPSKHDYTYYFKHNISITTSGFFSTAGLKFCIEQIGVERCLYSIDYPYDTISEAQTWWKEDVDLLAKDKEMVARQNAIRLFKLPLEL
ncbi:hypothetical protein B0T20DRAFT_346427 [Sordaria brevicollis]|uniref:Amidohydrolase-related domain-containing protein n=1 Tax=Sordaria brevicollis TaxID=83679 RepID=A0AAE0PM00_SORBR|nr:hypothetical protein B0T20DRAFT_346427 [Sordaria brevicollis]